MIPSPTSVTSAPRRGAFIVLEGVDRCGKTTQCGLLLKHLLSIGLSAMAIRFPDRTTAVGSLINNYLQSSQNLDDRAIHLLFSANRWEAVPNMQEQLAAGTTLICDRYAHSGVAFTSGKQLDGDLTVDWCKGPDIGLPAPDAVIFLNLSQDESEKRGGYGGERYEKRDLQLRVRGRFDELKESDAGKINWHMIDAAQSMEAVTTDIISVVEKVIKEVEEGKPLQKLWSADDAIYDLKQQTPEFTEIHSIYSMNAVVTGANRGLGLELVKQLCDKGDATSKIYALCRKTSEALSDLASNSNEKVSIVEGIDVSSDAVTEQLQSALSSTIPIDLLIHNAGAFGPPENFPDEASIYDSQTLESITMDRMRYAFELNTLGPLRVTQALLPNLKAAAATASETTTKVIIISSLMGSITDNTSGGIYGYRTAKAGVNMVGMSLAQDLKKDDTNIAVGLVHPGFVLTGFGGTDGKDHPEEKRRPGQQDVGPSAKGVLDAIDAITMENTGAFLHGNYGEGVKPLNW